MMRWGNGYQPERRQQTRGYEPSDLLLALRLIPAAIVVTLGLWAGMALLFAVAP